MKCKNCNEENLSSARFCKNCGERFFQAVNQITNNESQFSVPKGEGNNVMIGIVIAVILVVGGAFLAGQGFFANKNANVSQYQGNQNQSTTNQTSENPSKNNSVANSACGQVKDASGITYGTVLAEDGKCWLDRNLGATRVATSSEDESSYGWLFQWGRSADGHQLPTRELWTPSQSSQSSSDNPGHSEFITASVSIGTGDWRSPQNDNLWQGVDGKNNPCPVGFRLPTNTEWESLVSSAKINNSATAFSSSLKLAPAGFRLANGRLFTGASGTYWSSSPTGTDAYYLSFQSSGVFFTYGSERAAGHSVRCIKN